MTEKVQVEVAGKSLAEVAHTMALEILFNVEKKKWGEFTRKEYLDAHADAVLALRGSYV